jgi:hypothetical protein
VKNTSGKKLRQHTSWSVTTEVQIPDKSEIVISLTLLPSLHVRTATKAKLQASGEVTQVEGSVKCQALNSY